MSEGISVFTQSNCIYCENQLNWMNENNINYEEKNIDEPKNFEEFISLNRNGTPLTVIKEGKENVQFIVGFNLKKLQFLLKKSM